MRDNLYLSPSGEACWRRFSVYAREDAQEYPVVILRRTVDQISASKEAWKYPLWIEAHHRVYVGQRFNATAKTLRRRGNPPQSATPSTVPVECPYQIRPCFPHASGCSIGIRRLSRGRRHYLILAVVFPSHVCTRSDAGCVLYRGQIDAVLCVFPEASYTLSVWDSHCVGSIRTHGVQRLLDGARDARRRAQDLELVAVIRDKGDVVRGLVVGHGHDMWR